MHFALQSSCEACDRKIRTNRVMNLRAAGPATANALARAHSRAVGIVVDMYNGMTKASLAC
jgi:hypothetical protein